MEDKKEGKMIQTVGPEHKDLRLDVFLTQTLPHVPSRTFVKKIIDEGHVCVNEKQTKAHYKLREGDKIDVEIPDQYWRDERIDPENIPLDIFYEDEDIIVVNKPAGMLVHPAHGAYSGTLVNALLYHYQELSDLNTSVRPGIVHRLDQDTSGLILVAKNNNAHAHLARQFKDHVVKKRYIALVEGKVEFDEGLIDAPLGRHDLHREKMDVQFDNDAKDAETFYRVLKYSDNATLVALCPKTGRTHQLRVHMAYIGHPILGDEKYGKKNNFPRLALHAQSIGFIHPQRKCFVEFSSRVPKEFWEHVEKNRKK